MGLQTGWIEKRRDERKKASWNVTYQVIDAEEAAQLCRDYSPQGFSPNPERADASAARTYDLSAGGLAVIGSRSHASGTKLLLYIHHPRERHSLVVVAEVVHCVDDPFSPGSYRSGMRILGVDKSTLQRILDEL